MNISIQQQKKEEVSPPFILEKMNKEGKVNNNYNNLILEKMVSSLISLNNKRQQVLADEEDDEDWEFFFDEEEQREYYEDQLKELATQYAYELQQLGHVFTPPYLLDQPIKDEYINHSLVAERAVLELSTLALDNNGVFSTNDGILINQPPHATSSWTHASRASTVVNMDPTQMVKRLTNLYKWRDQLFPSIVSKVAPLRFLSNMGTPSRNPDGTLQLIYAELQTLTPFLPKRAFTFLRACKKIDTSTWVVADISIDRSRNIGHPCGCLIQGTADGFSQVTWVEHLEFEKNYLDQKLYTDLSSRGFGFGAQRWVACLERSCERRSYRANPCLIGGQEDQWHKEKKLVMTISKRMVRRFCLNIEPDDDTSPLSCVPTTRKMRSLVTLFRSPYHDDPKQMVLVSYTTFSLPQSPEVILEILGDEDRRHEWYVFEEIDRYRKPTCYPTDSDSRNKISIYQTCTWIGDEVVLQETSVNRSGSLLVWCFLKSKGSDDLAKMGKVGLLRLPLNGLSGLAISSNTTSINGGSIVTLSVQQDVRYIYELDPKILDVAKKHLMKVAARIVDFLNMAAAPEGVGGSTQN